MVMTLGAKPEWTALSAQGARPGGAVEPQAWLQLRGAADNAGSVPGTLDVSWRFNAERPVRGIAVAAGLVFAGTESLDAESAHPDNGDREDADERGSISALDEATGAPRWTRFVNSWIHGDPAVYRGTVFVTYGRWPMTTPGGVTAFDARSGRILWSRVAPSGFMPAPAIDTVTRSVFVIGGDGVLYSLAVADGTVRFRVGLKAADGMSSPRLGPDGELVVGATDRLVALSTRNGRVLWDVKFGLRALGDVPVAIADGIVFTTGWVVCRPWEAFQSLTLKAFMQLAIKAVQERHMKEAEGWFHQQWLVAVDARSGRVMWKRPLGVGLPVARNTSGTPTIAGPEVVVSSPVSHIVWAFAVNDGRPLWHHHLEATHKGAPTIVGENALLGDAAGTLVVLSLTDGSLRGQCKASGPFSATGLIVVGRTVVAPTRDGWLRATPYDSLVRRARGGNRACF